MGGEKGRERLKNTITMLLVKSECIAYMYIQKHVLSYIRRFCNFLKTTLSIRFGPCTDKKLLSLLHNYCFSKPAKNVGTLSDLSTV